VMQVGYRSVSLQPGAAQPAPAQSGSATPQPQSHPSSVPYQLAAQSQLAGAPLVPPVPVLRQLPSAVAWVVQSEGVALPFVLQVKVSVVRQVRYVLNWLLQLAAVLCRLWQSATQAERVSLGQAAVRMCVHRDEQVAVPVAPVPPVVITALPPVPPLPPDPPLLGGELMQASRAFSWEAQFEVVASPLESQV
jgi:hypothetical protein